MQTIWKWPLDISQGTFIKLMLPSGTVPLSVEFQRKKLMLWGKVNTENDLEERIFMVVTTGSRTLEHKSADKTAHFIGTAQLSWEGADSGHFVVHVFEVD